MTCNSGEMVIRLEREGERGKRSTFPDRHRTVEGFDMTANTATIPESGQNATPRLRGARA